MKRATLHIIEDLSINGVPLTALATLDDERRRLINAERARERWGDRLVPHTFNRAERAKAKAARAARRKSRKGKKQ